MLTIYKWLHNNNLSVIEDSTFNNLLNLQRLSIICLNVYNHIMSIMFYN